MAQLARAGHLDRGKRGDASLCLDAEKGRGDGERRRRRCGGHDQPELGLHRNDSVIGLEERDCVAGLHQIDAAVAADGQFVRPVEAGRHEIVPRGDPQRCELPRAAVSGDLEGRASSGGRHVGHAHVVEPNRTEALKRHPDVVGGRRRWNNSKIGHVADHEEAGICGEREPLGRRALLDERGTDQLRRREDGERRQASQNRDRQAVGFSDGNIPLADAREALEGCRHLRHVGIVGERHDVASGIVCQHVAAGGTGCHVEIEALADRDARKIVGGNRLKRRWCIGNAVDRGNRDVPRPEPGAPLGGLSLEFRLNLLGRGAGRDLHRRRSHRESHSAGGRENRKIGDILRAADDQPGRPGELCGGELRCGDDRQRGKLHGGAAATDLEVGSRGGRHGRDHDLPGTDARQSLERCLDRLRPCRRNDHGIGAVAQDHKARGAVGRQAGEGEVVLAGDRRSDELARYRQLERRCGIETRERDAILWRRHGDLPDADQRQALERGLDIHRIGRGRDEDPALAIGHDVAAGVPAHHEFARGGIRGGGKFAIARRDQLELRRCAGPAQRDREDARFDGHVSIAKPRQRLEFGLDREGVGRGGDRDVARTGLHDVETGRPMDRDVCAGVLGLCQIVRFHHPQRRQFRKRAVLADLERARARGTRDLRDADVATVDAHEILERPADREGVGIGRDRHGGGAVGQQVVSRRAGHGEIIRRVEHGRGAHRVDGQCRQ